MDANTTTAVRRTGHRESCSDAPTAMLSVAQVARLLNCSRRTVYRLNDAGRMPRPVRLGSLVRWNRAVIDRWIADGCPAARENRR